MDWDFCISSLKTQENCHFSVPGILNFARVETSRILNFAWKGVERSNQKHIDNKIFQVKLFKKSEDFILIVFIIFFENLRFISEIYIGDFRILSEGYFIGDLTI